MKKLISILLVLTVLVTAAPVYAAADGYDRTEDALSQLNVWIPLQEDSAITRSYAVASIINLIGHSDLTLPVSEQGDKTYYNDVPLSYWALEDINLAYELGIISKNPDGMFYPNADITYEQLVKMLLVTMGYDKQAKEYGGYPLGYMITAGNVGILNGVKIDDGKASVSRYDFSRILCNVLDCEILYQSSYGIFPEYSRDKSFAEGMLGFTKRYGILNATDMTALSADRRTLKGYVEIGNTAYKDLTGYASQYLGMKVDFYTNSDDEIVCIVPGRINSVTELNTNTAYFSYSKSDRTFEYEESGITRKLEISNTADVIYNGRNYIGYPSTVFDFETGYIKLIDNDGDAVCDTVFITSYIAYRFEYYDEQSDTIYTADNDKIDTSKTVKVSDSDGNPITFNDILKGDIISVASSADKSYTEIVVSREYRVGRIKSVETVGTETRVVIGDDETPYKIINALKGIINSSAFGTFYLDFMGNVADYRYQETEYQYGYLIACGTDRGIGNTLKFKIFTQYGTTSIYNAANTFSIDGKKYNKSGSPKTSGMPHAAVALGAASASGDITPSVIRFKLNDNGEISGIDTPGSASSENEMKLISKGSAVYRDNAASMNGKVYVGGCMVFVIPDDRYDTDSYIITSASRLSNQTYDYAAYSVSSKHSADVLVIDGVSKFKTVSYDNAFAMVEKISAALVNDTEGVKLSLYTNKSVVELTVTDSETQKQALSLEPGDVIQYSTNANDEIIGIRYVYDKSRNKFCSYGKTGDRIEYSFGYITDRDDGIIGYVKGSVVSDAEDEQYTGTMVFPSLNDEQLVYSLHFADIILFDSAAREGSKIKRITPQDINDYSGTAVMNIGYSRVKSLYIYK